MERLETIQEATELGAGLRVAMRDLEIRGAGNMLGAEQSGHIATVGYELYVRLLSQAIEEVRTRQADPGAGSGHARPAAYRTDPGRLHLGHRAPAEPLPPDRRQSRRSTEADELEDELRDRFGDFPEEVEHLFALITAANPVAALGIDSVVERDREIVIRPVQTDLIDRSAPGIASSAMPSGSRPTRSGCGCSSLTMPLAGSARRRARRSRARPCATRRQSSRSESRLALAQIGDGRAFAAFVGLRRRRCARRPDCVRSSSRTTWRRAPVPLPWMIRTHGRPDR